MARRNSAAPDTAMISETLAARFSLSLYEMMLKPEKATNQAKPIRVKMIEMN